MRSARLRLISDGDLMGVEIERIGRLENRCAFVGVSVGGAV